MALSSEDVVATTGVLIRLLVALDVSVLLSVLLALASLDEGRHRRLDGSVGGDVYTALLEGPSLAVELLDEVTVESLGCLVGFPLDA